MMIKHFYYCVLYFFHIRALGKLSYMEANQLSRSMKSRSICSTKTKLTPSWRVSPHHDDSGQVHYSREKSNNRSSTGNSKHKNLTCNYYHKKRHIRSECWLQKKKQSDANVTELVGGDKEQCDVLSIIDRSVGNENRWIIYSGCSQHINSNRKMFSL